MKVYIIRINNGIGTHPDLITSRVGAKTPKDALIQVLNNKDIRIYSGAKIIVEEEK